MSFSKIAEEAKEFQKYIAYCNSGDRNELKSVYLPHKPCLILIGPEGDFTENEITLAKKNQFIPVSLGNSRLRTETAGVVACTFINLLNS